MYNPALSCYIQSTTIIIIIIIIQWMLKACIIIIECSEAGSMFHNRKLAKANDLLSRWVLVYSTTHMIIFRCSQCHIPAGIYPVDMAEPGCAVYYLFTDYLDCMCLSVQFSSVTFRVA